MFDLCIYSLKAGVCLAVFYLFFKLLLSRETLHRFNRALVLSGMALAFALPLCVITVYRELLPLPETTLAEASQLPVVLPEDETAFDWQALVGALFGVGAVGMLLWTLRSLVAVLRIVRSGRHERLGGGIVLVHVPQTVAPFSWGRYIVVSDADLTDSGQEILLHEQAHVRLHHSVDLLLTDLAGCLQWFNPAMWLLRRELRAIHEYEADRAVIESGADARDYQLLLIRKAVGGRWYSIANSFNHSKLKNRITMMLRKKSSRWTGARALFVLPLTVVALGAFARTAYVVPDDKVTKDSVTTDVSGPNISLSGLDGKPLVLVDGRETSLQEIPARRVVGVQVIKGEQAVRTYGDRARDGVVLVTLREECDDSQFVENALRSDETSRQPDPAPLYIVDGQEVGADDLKGIASDRIVSIDIYKDSLHRARYGEKARHGVIEIKVDKEGSAKADKRSVKIDDATIVISGSSEEDAVREKIDAYFNSDEWKQAQKKMAEANAYFQSDEWKNAMQRLTEAGLQTAAALQEPDAESLHGQIVSIHADRYKEEQDESSVTRSKGRITVTGTTGIPDDCLIFINGKRATKAELAAIPSGRIRRMDIYKGQQAVDKFGPEAVGGAIDIKARKR